MPRLVNNAIRRDIHDFDKPAAGQFQAPPRCRIPRIAGNPKPLKLQSRGNRNEQCERARSIAMASVRRVNGKSNMAGVSLDMRSGAGPQINPAQFLPAFSVNHAEAVRRHPMDRMVINAGKLQLQLPVPRRGSAVDRAQPQARAFP
jgi:hypothetical protein